LLKNKKLGLQRGPFAWKDRGFKGERKPEVVFPPCNAAGGIFATTLQPTIRFCRHPLVVAGQPTAIITKTNHRSQAAA